MCTLQEFIQDLCPHKKTIRSVIQTSYSFSAKMQHYCKHLITRPLSALQQSSFSKQP